MKRALLPSFIATVALASACGGGQSKQEPPIATNPPAPDGSPGIGDGAGPPPDLEGDGEAPAQDEPPAEDGEAPADDVEG